MWERWEKVANPLPYVDTIILLIRSFFSVINFQASSQAKYGTGTLWFLIVPYLKCWSSCCWCCGRFWILVPRRSSLRGFCCSFSWLQVFGRCSRWNLAFRRSVHQLNSVLLVFHNQESLKKCFFSSNKHQGLRQLLLTLSWDLRDRCPCISVVPDATHEASRGPLKGAVSVLV